MNPITLYLYSTPNLVGSSAGIIGLLLTAVGVINTGWLFIVFALYGIGALIAHGMKKPVENTLAVNHQESTAKIKQDLAAVVELAELRLPSNLAQHVRSIRDSIETVLDRSSGSVAGDQMLYNVRQTALDFLPTTLNKYYTLPAAFAKLKPIKDNKTATVLLEEQLLILDKKMEEIADNVLAGDAQGLLTNGQFLKDKFGETNRLLQIPTKAN